MNFIKKYKEYLESLQFNLSNQTIDLMESLNIWHDVLLASISAQEVNIFKTLSLPSDSNIDIVFLNDSIEFINSLSSIGLKKSQVQSTDDFETFVNKPCRFMLVYDMNSNELENPEYILFQSFNETLKEWQLSKLYKVNDDIKKFYDRLSSKTIEIIDGDDKYIYSTANGNDWQLQNQEKSNDTYKKSITKEELQEILDEKSLSLNII